MELWIVTVKLEGHQSVQLGSTTHREAISPALVQKEVATTGHCRGNKKTILKIGILLQVAATDL